MMTSTPGPGRVAALAFLSAVLVAGCASGGAVNATRGVSRRPVSYSSTRVSQEQTRRSLEREYKLSARFGTPRGRQFEDVIPVGARIAAVHVAHDDTIRAVWLTFERGGREYQTPRRGGAGSATETFKLGSREKIVGIYAYGKPAIETIEIATNRRVVALGAPVPPEANPWYAQLTTDEKRQLLGVGIIGRTDDRLRQVTLRIQIRRD